MRVYRLLNIERGLVELSNEDKYWFDVTKRAKRHTCMDNCELAHEVYGNLLLNNECTDLFHIMEPGKIVTIEHQGLPVYVFTSDITKYHVIHHSPLILSISLPLL